MLTHGRLLRVVLLLITTATASALRCNTYIGTDVTTGGPGIETCLPLITECVMRKFHVFGVPTYTMSCDDLLQCASLPKQTCCTKITGDVSTVLRCSDTNFNETRINSTSFGTECSANCSHIS